MVISTNPKPTIYGNLYENTGLVQQSSHGYITHPVIWLGVVPTTVDSEHAERIQLKLQDDITMITQSHVLHVNRSELAVWIWHSDFCVPRYKQSRGPHYIGTRPS